MQIQSGLTVPLKKCFAAKKVKLSRQNKVDFPPKNRIFPP
jgi:hypothetical protein